MDGKVVKQVISGMGRSLAEVARSIGMSQQNFSKYLSYTDVKSGLIERISEVLGITVADFYHRAAHGGEALSISSTGDNSPNINGNGNNVDTGSAVMEKMADTISAQQATIAKQADIISGLVSKISVS